MAIDIGPDHHVRCAEKKCLGPSCPYRERCNEPMRINAGKGKIPALMLEGEKYEV